MEIVYSQEDGGELQEHRDQIHVRSEVSIEGRPERNQRKQPYYYIPN
jgi:hypothetical protein